jgi:hypothetical protein|tara:strand:+ start:148 stop:348 length:201 start_codon:yes stop_codon:yes gene_type:complete
MLNGEVDIRISSEDPSVQFRAPVDWVVGTKFMIEGIRVCQSALTEKIVLVGQFFVSGHTVEGEYTP